MAITILKNSKLIRVFPHLNQLNLGLLIVSIHIFFDLGAFQQLIDFVVPLRIPYYISICSLVYALYLCFCGRYNPFQSKLSSSYTLLITFIFIYAFFTSKNIESRNNALKLLITYYANYVILVCSVKNIFQLSLLIDTFLLAILHSSYHAIKQGGLIWSSKWLGDENEISVLVVCAIPFAFHMFLLYKNPIRKFIYGFAMAAFITTIIRANSRGGALAFFAAGLFCFTFIEKKLRAIVILSVISLCIFVYAPQKWFTEVKSIGDGTQESTAFDRTYGWKLATLMFQDYPILGVGMFNYPEVYVPYNLRYRVVADRHPNRDPNIKRVAHSTQIEWIAETGLFGTSLILLVLWSLFSNWKLINYSDNGNEEHNLFLKAHNHATIIALMGFGVGAFFVSILIWPFFWILLPLSEIARNLLVSKND